MKIHFVCRGNVFRSFIAETYLRSLNLDDVEVHSSGTIAAEHKAENTPRHRVVREVIDEHALSEFTKDSFADQLEQSHIDNANLVVFANQPAKDEADTLVDLGGTDTATWHIEDFNEGENPDFTDDEFKDFVRKGYDEIVDNVNKLVRNRGLISRL